MKKLILQFSTGKRILILFLLSTTVYVLMLAVTIPKTTAFANGMKLPDMMPEGYNQKYIMDLFTALGEQGRYSYLYQQLPLDMVYPTLFALCYSLMLAYFLKKINRQHGLLIYLSYLPLIGGLADYAENLGLIVMLKQFPGISETLIVVNSGFSVVKSSTTTVYFAVLLFVLGALAINQFKWKK